MNASHRKRFRFTTAFVLLLSVCLIHPLGAEADLAAEVDQALSQAGPAGDTFDATVLFRLQALVRQAGTPEQLRAIESRLVAALDSAIPWSTKQDVCRILWTIGTAQSAPALKKLLAQPETVEIACYAIAKNPIPELGQAVRDTLPGSAGKVTVSLLNLLGQRRDGAALDLILPWLKNEQPAIAEAAATALGKIGGQSAVTALDRFRIAVPKDRRVMADAAYLRAIESLPPANAVDLWKELVAAKQESVPVRREAFLRLSEHAPEAVSAWLLAALRGEEPELTPATGLALRTLRDQTIVGLVAARLDEFPASSQAIVVEAIGHDLAIESLVDLPRHGGVRSPALRMLATREEPEAARALLTEALSPEKIDDRAEIFRLLGNMPGPAATDALLNALPATPAALLSDVVQVLTARKAEIPLPVILDRTRGGDQDDRIQTIRALRFAASAGDHAVLFDLLKTAAEPGIHEAVEETIAVVFSHSGNLESEADWLHDALKSADRPQDRQSFLRLLAQTGTAKALQVVTAQLDTGHAEDREVAFRALTQWPNESAIDPLLAVLREPLNEAQLGLAFRGAVRLLRESQLPAAQKADRYRQLLPQANTPERSKLLLSGLAEVDDAGAMDLIVPFLDNPAVRAEAAVSAIAVASHLGPSDERVVDAAMNRVLAVVQDANLRAQAQARIHPQPLPPPTDAEGFTSLFDGQRFAGWEGNQQMFRIQDGAIVGGSLNAPVPRNEFVCTTNRYSDFELRLKFKLIGADANGGVQLRSPRVQ
ncbi:MAG: DUF1080 domain-containing protein, partial [Candidatus Omnitrophica bacterium]|nr:DUF1080 domain-containing protein [Candidatus Omnitrophota bacterium]